MVWAVIQQNTTTLELNAPKRPFAISPNRPVAAIRTSFCFVIQRSGRLENPPYGQFTNDSCVRQVVQKGGSGIRLILMCPFRQITAALQTEVGRDSNGGFGRECEVSNGGFRAVQFAEPEFG